MDCVYLSVLWLVCSLPLVTVGAASAALYSTAFHCVKEKDDTILHRFFSVFRSEFRQASFSWLLWAAVLASYSVLWLFIFSLGDSTAAWLLMVSAFAVSFCAVGALCWVFPIQARFRVSFKEQNFNALRMVFARPGTTILLMLLLLLSAAACLTWMFPLLLLPGLTACLSCFPIEKAFSEIKNKKEEPFSNGK